MWENVISCPFALRFKRNYFAIALTTLVVSLAYSLVFSPTAYATDATMSGDVITYEGNAYTKNTGTLGGQAANIPANKAYRYDVPDQFGVISAQKVNIIYFSATADPATATDATFVTYIFNPPDGYTSPQDTKTISIIHTSSSPGTKDCDSSRMFGFGWVICGTTRMLANAMDFLFGLLTNFLTVRPVSLERDSALHRAWSLARDFANVAFVIGFIIIIYSQLTSIGLSNYNIKRLIPRIVVAAILVNISYELCAVAVDASNILGVGVQDLFVATRKNLVGPEGNTWDIGWSSMADVILGGTAAGTAGTLAALAAVDATGTALGAALWLLLPILIGVILAVFVALLIMAARQAIITILVVVSPLAFVAYLLPNTEKYFDKWKDLFVTMLVFFPAVAFVFGGAQLAGAIIIQNANSIAVILFGMAVQVAPVVITPLLLKFSGSLLGRIAGIVNNPTKGLVDRTRNVAQERAGVHKAKALSDPQTRLKKFASSRDLTKRRRKRMTDDYTRSGDNLQNEKLDDEILRGTTRYSKQLRDREDGAGVIAAAATASRERFGKLEKEQEQLIKYFGVGSADRQTIAMGGDVTAKKFDKNGNLITQYEFKGSTNAHTRDMAIDMQMETGGEGQKRDLFISAAKGGVNEDYRTTISAGIKDYGLPKSMLYTGGKIIDDVYTGAYTTANIIPASTVFHITEGKIKPEVMAEQGAQSIKDLVAARTALAANPSLLADDKGYVDPAVVAKFQANYDNMLATMQSVLGNSELRPKLSKASLDEMEKALLANLMIIPPDPNAP